jgi:hypothetical protein
MEKTKKLGKINLVCEPFDKRLKNFIDTEKWTYAKTMPEWPHEYIVKERVDETLFIELVSHIRKYGHEGYFYSKTMVYFDQDGYTYWTMGAPLEETITINRTQKKILTSNDLKTGLYQLQTNKNYGITFRTILHENKRQT